MPNAFSSLQLCTKVFLRFTKAHLWEQQDKWSSVSHIPKYVNIINQPKTLSRQTLFLPTLINRPGWKKYKTIINTWPKISKMAEYQRWLHLITMQHTQMSCCWIGHVWGTYIIKKTISHGWLDIYFTVFILVNFLSLVKGLSFS